VEPSNSSDLLQTGDLLARIRRGDRAAGEELFQRYRPRIAAFVRARVRPGVHKASDADDVVQDVCVKIWNALDGFEERGIGSFWWFARTLARHHLIDLARRQRAAHETKLDTATHVAPAAQAPGPLRDAVDHEAAEAVDEALEKLPAQTRHALAMRLELDLDWSVIAVDCGFPSPDAARIATKRALVGIAKGLPGLRDG
jgi:RNA polymerase sigma-70 factor (ECF subfamily)